MKKSCVEKTKWFEIKIAENKKVEETEFFMVS